MWLIVPEEDIYNIRTLSEHLFVQALETGRKTNFSSLFHSDCKFILYLTKMYVYCVYPAISKCPNCLKITETSAILIISFCHSI